MKIGPWQLCRVEPTARAELPKAQELFGRDGYHRHGQMIGVISVIGNGYLVSLGSGQGEVSDMRYAEDEHAVGMRLLEFVAKQRLKK